MNVDRKRSSCIDCRFYTLLCTSRSLLYDVRARFSGNEGVGAAVCGNDSLSLLVEHNMDSNGRRIGWILSVHCDSV